MGAKGPPFLRMALTARHRRRSSRYRFLITSPPVDVYCSEAVGTQNVCRHRTYQHDHWTAIGRMYRTGIKSSLYMAQISAPNRGGRRQVCLQPHS